MCSVPSVVNSFHSRQPVRRIEPQRTQRSWRGLRPQPTCETWKLPFVSWLLATLRGHHSSCWRTTQLHPDLCEPLRPLRSSKKENSPQRPQRAQRKQELRQHVEHERLQGFTNPRRVKFSQEKRKFNVCGTEVVSPACELWESVS